MNFCKGDIWTYSHKSESMSYVYVWERAVETSTKTLRYIMIDVLNQSG